jgi:hypothetical protein
VARDGSVGCGFRPCFGCGMVARLRQHVVSKTFLWMAVLSLFLPPRYAPCSCGDDTIANGYATRKAPPKATAIAVEQTIRPSCCGQRDDPGASGTDSCCSTRPEPRGVGRCCQGLERQPASCCRADCRPDAVSVTQHAGGCTCGERCECGSPEPSSPPAAPAASSQRSTERAAGGLAVTSVPAFCVARAGCSAADASLVPRVAACGRCVQFCHLTI